MVGNLTALVRFRTLPNLAQYIFVIYCASRPRGRSHDCQPQPEPTAEVSQVHRRPGVEGARMVLPRSAPRSAIRAWFQISSASQVCCASRQSRLDNRKVMTWSVDFMADDWHRRIAAAEIVKRGMLRR